MAGSVNKVILVGFLGKDPEVRSTQDGAKIANFSMATSESWKDKNSGERKEKSEWHKISIFNDRVVEVVEKYLTKGSHVYVEGSLQTRKWTDQQGQDRYTTEVVIGRFNGQLQMLGSAGEGGERSSSGGGQSRGNSGGGARGGAAGPSWETPKGGDLDDDIPF